MTLTAVLLLTLSAFLHAGWNLAGKKGNPTIAFFFSAALLGVLSLLPFPILFHSVLRYFSPRIWLLLASTGLCMSVYYIGLSGAYQRGDMSVAYPMVRSIPIVMVAFVSLVLGRGEAFSGVMLGGIGLIVIGAFVLPMSSFRDFKVSNYCNHSNFFALIAALGTVGYSLIDDAALRLVRTSAGDLSGSWRIAIVYAFFEGLSSSIWLGIFLLINRSKGKNASYGLVRNLKSKAITGAGIYIAYSLALISMAFVRDVSYVVAFRQLSLTIGVLFGVVFLKEKAHIPKFLGVTLIFAGLVLVGLS